MTAAAATTQLATPAELSAGDTAWLLVATALVLLMTPGLALFYGGMVRAKSVLNMIMMSFSAIAVVTVVWFACGWSLAFGNDLGSGVLGDFGQLFLHGMKPESMTGSVPTLVVMAFQLTFAIITVALISGAIADRAKFRAWLVFCAVWVTLVYVPLAHWVWGPGGWIHEKLGALDYAGGLVVEINSGAAGLAVAIVLGPRIGFKRDPMRPHNLPLVMLGAGLLWFGWFGFNGGSALAANGIAAQSLVNTQAAACTALLGWLVVEKRRDGHATTLGAASGAVAGLVAITPSCGVVDLTGALLIGLAAGVLCSYAVGWKHRFGYDDSLDVVGVHFVGGVVGTVLIGLFAWDGMTGVGGPRGLLHGGGVGLLGKQLVAVVVAALFSFAVTYAIAKVIDRTMGFRASADDELAGLDLAVHAETAYDLGSVGAASHLSSSTASTTKPRPVRADED
ncbi:ammonium transporter [Yinghuangia seranimata]|uniref:ammonium transporter n=1 Tax=Yinghuangia seranimata TaxID=408067 RepID=UPI00248B0EDD|nr:ammonium transporter [Yinghuangia seranimata]MDI2132228.1 ammonium transporter [Yinghuangia seranimata]